jgi:hypothetical protein
LYGTIVGDGAVMSGWLARAQRLLLGTVDSPEAGWVSLNIGMFEGDRTRKEERFREALASARRFRDTDLEFVTLAYLGASLVHADRTEEGMVLLDEALAAVAGREVDDFCVLQEIFCQLFAACEHAHDVTRADQWIRIGEAIAARRHLPAVSAFCRTHYGGLLTAAGYNKDPITAQGIPDAFRDAELCSTALEETFNGLRTFEDAMSDYHRTRDAQVLPMYGFTTQLATLEPPPPEMQQLLGAVHGNREAMNAFVSVTAGTVSPVEFFAPEHIGSIMSAAAASVGN